MGNYFPPWMVTWHVVLHPGVSGIVTDVMLFHQHGGRLVHCIVSTKTLFPMCPYGERLYEN